MNDYIPATNEKVPPKVFGHNSLPRALAGTRIGGDGSYQPPGPPRKALNLIEPDVFQKKIKCGILTWIGECRPGNKTIFIVFAGGIRFFRSQDVKIESRPSFFGKSYPMKN